MKRRSLTPASPWTAYPDNETATAQDWPQEQEESEFASEWAKHFGFKRDSLYCQIFGLGKTPEVALNYMLANRERFVIKAVGGVAVLAAK